MCPCLAWCSVLLLYRSLVCIQEYRKRQEQRERLHAGMLPAESKGLSMSHLHRHRCCWLRGQMRHHGPSLEYYLIGSGRVGVCVSPSGSFFSVIMAFSIYSRGDRSLCRNREKRVCCDFRLPVLSKRAIILFLHVRSGRSLCHSRV